MRFKVTVLIRLYDRVSDCVVNLDIIRRFWTRNDYSIIVVSNGSADGYNLPHDAVGDATLVKLSSNSGHIKGNSELLLAGARNIPANSNYTVILESDTWVLDDQILKKYIDIMEEREKCVWASANWVDKYHSLAVDFAIIKSSFLRENSGIFIFTGALPPENTVLNYIGDKGYEYVNISEIYPVHLPKIVPFGPQVFGRRRNAFPSVPMVTHHIEYLKNSISTKKGVANLTAGKRIFTEVDDAGKSLKLYRLYLLLFEKLLLLAPKSRWFKGRKKRKPLEK